MKNLLFLADETDTDTTITVTVTAHELATLIFGHLASFDSRSEPNCLRDNSAGATP
jgi:hypothetical protein